MRRHSAVANIAWPELFRHGFDNRRFDEDFCYGVRRGAFCGGQYGMAEVVGHRLST